MKNLITSLIVVLSLVFISGCDKETILPEQDVPIEIKNYISTHFPDCNITKTIKEKGEKEEMYEVTLSCGVKLEFNKAKSIIDIDGTSKLPDSVIPVEILNYVNFHYPGNHVVGWEIQSNNQEIQLNNGFVLIFTMSGDFLRVEN
ncbi:MAG: PepSY-like domain-containing protein [Crocinitomicaceae bacterium]|nr:PepSY-like domain-containing protein [Crocinitomicaceae bacterium]